MPASLRELRQRRATVTTITEGNGNFRLTYGNTTLQSEVIRFSNNPLTMTGNISPLRFPNRWNG